MKSNLSIPKKPLSRFADIYSALCKNKHYYDSKNCLRFASLASLALPGDAELIAETINIYSDDIRNNAGVLDSPNSPIRFIISTILLQYGLAPERLFHELEHTGKVFRSIKLRNGHIYEKVAILLLRTQNKDSIPFEAVQRFKEIYDELKKYHWWYTGPENYPICAILALQNDSPAEIGYKIEVIYEKLTNADFLGGTFLQTAAQLLYISGISVDVIAARYILLAKAFEQHLIRISKADYDELAILSFLNHSAKRIIHTVVENIDRLKKVRPTPNKDVLFNMAAGISFFELIQRDELLQPVADLENVLTQNKVLVAQQAALVISSANCNALHITE